ncbi:MAG: PKD domain-containing protein, partial [Candidatus Gracilibacteria bacterium]|nr:PKD domain-containing protein [Candidatus Gracilibacteria bacterium]
MKKLLIAFIALLSISQVSICFAETNYIQAVISGDEAVELQKSTIFDASQSFISNPDSTPVYKWDFGDGNSNEGVEVLHLYKNPGKYEVTLT